MERHLDNHCKAILKEYRDNLPRFEKEAAEAFEKLKQTIDEAGLHVAALEYRVKTEESLAGKLELKGSKYKTLSDITDIVGIRVITFYIDDVDKVSSAIDRLFDIDWANTIDKRKLHEIDSFGYMSLHYICSLGDFPYRFEIQIRTVLQHAWANISHDTGYKSGVEVPKEYLRNLNRLAGMLELADEQFSSIRSELADYRRRVKALVASGNLDDVPLDGDSYRSYLDIRPFDVLNKRIAAVNQAEIQEVSLMPYLEIFKWLGMKTLGDVSRLIKDYFDGAYQIACYQIGLTDIDIISSSLGPQDLCVAYIMKNGGGKAGIRHMFDSLGSPSQSNEMLAAMLAEQAADLPFMNQRESGNGTQE